MNLDNLWVVAGALTRADGLWLMHRRPLEKQHGGLWEFPGGKVERTERPKEALCRELKEELGIRVLPEACEALSFTESDSGSGQPPIVILLYKIERWAGDAQALEGGAVDWFDASALRSLSMPPLDAELVSRLFVR
ncbi:MAG: (deoxy)nucleoside triphosphate pyrophosphohydrolase [Pseudomonadota bacterium]